MKVLIVSPATMFRARVRKALAELEAMDIAGSLSKAAFGLQIAEQRPVDLLIIGLSPAVEDDLAVIEKIKASQPAMRIILCFDADTKQHLPELKARMRRLEAGGFVIGSDEKNTDESHQIDDLKRFISAFIAKHEPTATPPPPLTAPSLVDDQAVSNSYRKVNLNAFNPMICVIASSTGGPAALEVVVSKLNGRTPRIPVLLVQHMPETFTRNLALRLTDLSGVEVREAVNGEPVRPGVVLIAPGNYHMRLNRSGDTNYIHLDQGPKVNSVRPAADLLFTSAAQLYGPACMGLVLTGMGEDGCAGAKAIKQAGGGILIQDRDSCVVWGMPAAVEKAGAYDATGDLLACADYLARFCSVGRAA